MELLTIREFARQYGYPEHFVRSGVAENLIPFIRAGNRAYLCGEVVEAAIKCLMEKNTSVCGYGGQMKKKEDGNNA